MFFLREGPAFRTVFANNNWLCEGTLPRAANLLGEKMLLRRDLTKIVSQMTRF